MITKQRMGTTKNLDTENITNLLYVIIFVKEVKIISNDKYNDEIVNMRIRKLLYNKII